MEVWSIAMKLQTLKWMFVHKRGVNNATRLQSLQTCDTFRGARRTDNEGASMDASMEGSTSTNASARDSCERSEIGDETPHCAKASEPPKVWLGQVRSYAGLENMSVNRCNDFELEVALVHQGSS